MPRRGAQRAEAEAKGTGDRATGRKEGAGAGRPRPPTRPPAAPTGLGSSGHKVSGGHGAGGRTHPLGGIVLLHHSGRAGGRGRRGAAPRRGPRPLRGGSCPGGGCGEAPGAAAAAPPSLPLPFFVAPVTLKAGLPRARTHTHARSPPLGALHPGAHAARAPESSPAARPPGPARPLPRPGALWAAQPAPRSSIHPPADVASSE